MIFRCALFDADLNRDTGTMFKTTLDRFCWWLEQTDASQAIQSTAWVVPAVQTVHILAIATVLGAALMLNLRLLGLAGVDQPLARQSQRYLPVIWWTLPCCSSPESS